MVNKTKELIDIRDKDHEFYDSAWESTCEVYDIYNAALIASNKTIKAHNIARNAADSFYNVVKTAGDSNNWDAYKTTCEDIYKVVSSAYAAASDAYDAAWDARDATNHAWANITSDTTGWDSICEIRAAYETAWAATWNSIWEARETLDYARDTYFAERDAYFSERDAYFAESNAYFNKDNKDNKEK